MRRGKPKTQKKAKKPGPRTAAPEVFGRTVGRIQLAAGEAYKRLFLAMLRETNRRDLGFHPVLAIYRSTRRLS